MVTSTAVVARFWPFTGLVTVEGNVGGLAIVLNSAPDRNGSAFDVFDDNSVGADPGVRANFDRPQNLRAGADIDMVANLGQSSAVPGPDCNLLEYQAIDSDFGVRMNHDAICVRNKKAAANLAVERNIGTCHRAPKAMSNDQPFEK
jgi:hypothetical protein